MNIKTIKSDAFAYLETLRYEKTRFGLVFLDPPYATDYINKAMIFFTENRLLTAGCFIVCEHARNADPDFYGFELVAKKKYGETAVTVLKVNE